MSSLSPHQDTLPHPSAVSPNDPRSSPATSPNSSSATSSNAQLATLLATTCHELEALRLELKVQTQRAEKAERMLQNMNHVSDPASNDNLRIISDYEERIRRAEVARDEAEARRRIIADGWVQFERYLNTLETRMIDARAGFTRVVTEGGGSLVLAPVPGLSPAGPNMPPPPPRQPPLLPSSRSTNSATNRNSTSSQSFQSLALPPPPNPNPNPTSFPTSRVRPRAGSLDGSTSAGSMVGQPPAKKYRGDRDDRRAYDDRLPFADFSHSQPLQQAHTYHALDFRERERDYPDQRSGFIGQSPNSRLLHPNDDFPGRQSRSRSGRSRSRDSAHSNRSSLSVDELLAETIDGPNGALPGNGSPHPSLDARAARHRHRPRDDSAGTRVGHPPSEHNSYHPHAVQHHNSQRTGLPESPPHPPYAQRGNHTHADEGNTSSTTGTVTQPGGQVQVYQTHVFAPVVTGAPVKKTKYGTSQGSVGNLNGANGVSTGAIGSVDAVPPAPPPPSFPASNAQGQRICRQCGLPGRYKDGKCVEKWGPGPMGPGTVCDRCRKKMKRVERRGTLAESQQSQSSSTSSIAQQALRQPVQTQVTLAQSKVADRTLHRGDTTIISPSSITSPNHGLTPPVGHGQRDRDELINSRPNSRAAIITTISSSSTAAGTAVAGINPSSGKSVRPPSPPTNPSLPDDSANSGGNRGRKVGSTSRTQSRSSSKTPRGSLKPATSTGNGSLSVSTGDGVVSKRSPLASGSPSSNGVGQKNGSVRRISPGNGSRSAHTRMDVDGDPDADGDGDGVEDGDGEMDADADADVEVEAEIDDADAEIAGVVDGLMIVGGKGEMDTEVDGDADADLLEAVDAAEANGNGSVASGWLKAEV